MERKPDIQYIHQFYVYGSEATAPELKPVKKKNRARIILPKPQIHHQISIRFDIASLCGILVACVMMVLLTVGIYQLSQAHREFAQMESYVIALQNENVDLQKTYHAGYDLDDIREKALALGMIPIEEAQTIPIQVNVPQPEPEPTMWENICWFFRELFA
ncbi:MAG: hypothetical protein J6C98_03185 [Oscillospiraceae bacterium]|nr:hypothetical protein [Oscillospiraceae bacterium]